uniref:Variant surface glycoprotein n=1 Tax=Trypanosoma brucei TaxID=5691 RepID=S5FWY1_9TRYP|nr:variant surface glycoprotein [Trypanosoma brucei]
MMNQLTLPVLAAALVFLGTSSRVYGAAGDGTNAADFAVLCTLDRLASASVEETYPKVDTTPSALSEIRAIVAATTTAANITEVPEDSNTNEEEARQKACPASASNETECVVHWNKWRAVKKAAATSQNKKYPPLDAAQRTNPAAAGYIKALHDLESAATMEQSTAENKATTAADPAKSSAKTQLTNAKYGAGLTEFKEGTGNTPGPGKGSSREGACKSPNAGSSIVHDLICLCVADNTATGSVCGVTANQCSGAGLEACTGANKKAAYGQLWQACQASTQAKLSPTTIHAALAAFSSRLKQDPAADPASNAAVYLGASQTQACGGTTSKLCVDYTAGFKDSKGRKDIYWYGQMEAAAAALETLDKEQTAVRQTMNKLEQLAAQAKQLYTFVQLAPTTTGQITDKPKHDTNTRCDTHKANSTCTADNNCKWDSTTATTGDFCKSKQTGTETPSPAAGTGEGAAKEGAAASTGCAQHFTDQKECEKMNEGKEKPVCAWKKGGENDKDKDEFRCRNGSFLLNKQFALSVVSAAFATLLF